jgi:hypothetical protein
MEMLFQCDGQIKKNEKESYKPKAQRFYKGKSIKKVQKYLMVKKRIMNTDTVGLTIS